MHNWRALLVSFIEICPSPCNKLIHGVTANRCVQSDKIKDSRSILEETDSHHQYANLRSFTIKQSHLQILWLSVVERKKKTTTTTAAECKMGATNIKVVHFSLHLFCASCLLSSPDSSLFLVTAEHEDSGVWGREWLRYLYSLARWGGGGVGNCDWGSNDI